MKKFLIPIGVMWVVVSFVIGVMIMLLPSKSGVVYVREKKTPRPFVQVDKATGSKSDSEVNAKVRIITPESEGKVKNQVTITK